MFSILIAAVTAATAVLTATVSVPIPVTVPPPGVPAGAPWVDPDDYLDVLDTYGSTGLHLLCTGDYTGTATERAVLGDEDSVIVDDILDIRDYYDIPAGQVAC